MLKISRMALWGLAGLALTGAVALERVSPLPEPKLSLNPKLKGPHFTARQPRHSVNGCSLGIDGIFIVRRIIALEYGAQLFIDERGTAKKFTGGAYTVGTNSNGENTVVIKIIDSEYLNDPGPYGDVAREGLQIMRECNSAFPKI